MAVPNISDPISLAGIKAEIDNNAYDATAVLLTSLLTISSETSINTNSSSYPNTDVPYGISEWAGYDHDAASAFADSNAVSKSISEGVGEAINIEDTDGHFRFIQTSSFSFSIWVRAGWTSSLNTNIHLWAMNDGSSTNANQKMKAYYNESNNRLELSLIHI